MTLSDSLSRHELERLHQKSDLHGFLALATTWGIIAASFALVGSYPNAVSILAALTLLGGRRLALGILMHDAAHYSLFKTRSLNDWVGKWLCAYPTWQDLRRYRPHHLWHHAFAGTKNDPDLELVSPFPVTTGSMARKLLRDFSGLSGLKHVYGLLAMDLGFIENTVSARTTKIAGAENSSLRHIAQTALQNSHGVVITNFLLFWILWALGHPELYALWIVSFLTTFSAFVRIRSIAEHAGTELDPDPFKCTRTTLANWLARLTVAPHRVNYHLEHHLLMSVPSFRFPLFHQTLLEKGLLTSAHLARSYFEVLKLASAKSQ